MDADCIVVTAVVPTWKVPVDWPAATVTVVGTVAQALSLLSDTVAVTEATPLRYTVPVEDPPPKTEEGLTVTALTVRGLTCSPAPALEPPTVAVMATDCIAVTAVVLIWNVAVDWPAATVTEAGTVAQALLLFSETVVLAATTPPRKTVPVEDPPPVTVGGFRLRTCTVMGETLSAAPALELPRVAVMDTA
jgi:hypothetical protein